MRDDQNDRRVNSDSLVDIIPAVRLCHGIASVDDQANVNSPIIPDPRYRRGRKVERSVERDLFACLQTLEFDRTHSNGAGRSVRGSRDVNIDFERILSVGVAVVPERSADLDRMPPVTMGVRSEGNGDEIRSLGPVHHSGSGVR